MTIEHVAIWTRNLEEMKRFYIGYFGGTAGSKYINPEKSFESFFIHFDSGARLELMQMPSVPLNLNNPADQYIGIIHLAMAVGSAGIVDALTQTLSDAGYTVISEPRHTGDGYYESCVLDPDGNRVEITV